MTTQPDPCGDPCCNSIVSFAVHLIGVLQIIYGSLSVSRCYIPGVITITSGLILLLILLDVCFAWHDVHQAQAIAAYGTALLDILFFVSMSHQSKHQCVSADNHIMWTVNIFSLIVAVIIFVDQVTEYNAARRAVAAVPPAYYAPASQVQVQVQVAPPYESEPEPEPESEQEAQGVRWRLGPDELEPELTETQNLLPHTVPDLLDQDSTT
jgi:hypothetical protein